MTERRPDDDDDGRAAGNRSQTRAVPDATSLAPRNTFGTQDPLRAQEGDAPPGAPRGSAPGKPAGTWGQTIAIGSAVPPPDSPHGPPAGAGHGSVSKERAVVVVPAVHTGQAAAHGQSPPPPPAPKAGHLPHRSPPPPQTPASDRPHPDLAHAAAEPLRVPSQRPAPTPYQSSQRAAKGTLLMTGLTPEALPKVGTPVGARPVVARTVPLGSDGKLAATPVPAPTPPAPAPHRAQAAPPGATRPMRGAAARAQPEDELATAGAHAGHGAQGVGGSPDLSFATTMPSVPPSDRPPEAAQAAPPRAPAPAPASPARTAHASVGREQISLKLADADFVQGASSSMPAGLPRRNPMMLVGGVVALGLVGLIVWLLFGREPAPAAPMPAATAPAAEVPGPVPVVPTPVPATTTPTPAPTTPTPQAEPVEAEKPTEPAPAAKPSSARKAAARRPSGGKKGGAAPSDDVSAARDALRALEREPVLKVKPSEEPEGDDSRLAPADAPSLAPPAPGE